MDTTTKHRHEGPHRGSLLVIFLTVFIDLLGFGIVLPLLPIYGEEFAVQHGLSPAQTGWIIGLLMSSFSIMQFIFLPLWGRLSDRYGRRPILMVGLAGSVVFYTLFGLATVWRSLTWLFVARLGAGIAGATISTAQAYIADTTTAKNRAKGMALIGAAFALGFTVGPVIGAASLLVGEGAQFSPWPGYVAALLSAFAFLLAVWLLPESLDVEQRHHSRWTLLDRSAWGTALAVPSIGLLLLTSFIAVMSFGSFESTLALEVKTLYQGVVQTGGTTGLLSGFIRTVRGFGYSSSDDIQLVVVLGTFTYLGLILTISQGFLVRRVAGRVSEGAMAFGGILASVVGFGLFSVAVQRSGYGLLCVAMAVIVVGFSFVTPSLQSLISRRTSSRRQGRVMGVAQSISSLARIVGPVVGIRLFTQSPPLPSWVSTAVMVIALLFLVVAVRAGVDHVATQSEREPSGDVI